MRAKKPIGTITALLAVPLVALGVVWASLWALIGIAWLLHLGGVG